MEKEFVTYELALRMKALGFDEPCFNLYSFKTKEFMYTIPNVDEVVMFKYGNHNKTNHISAPTFSQAFRWFREKYGLFTQPNRTVDKEGVWYYFSIETKRTDVCEGSFSYEEAELACMEKLIEIVENK